MLACLCCICLFSRQPFFRASLFQGIPFFMASLIQGGFRLGDPCFWWMGSTHTTHFAGKFVSILSCTHSTWSPSQGHSGASSKATHGNAVCCTAGIASRPIILPLNFLEVYWRSHPAHQFPPFHLPWPGPFARLALLQGWPFCRAPQYLCKHSSWSHKKAVNWLKLRHVDAMHAARETNKAYWLMFANLIGTNQ